MIDLQNLSPALRIPLAISLGAIPGALLRYYLTLVFARWLGTDFPFGTFIINISGAFLMGLVASLITEKIPFSPELKLIIATGFLGSYTTFSTYMLDLMVLWRSQSSFQGIILMLFYGLGSPILGFLGLTLGIRFATFWI